MPSLLRRTVLLAATACAFLAASVAHAATTPVGPGISKEPAPTLTVAAGASATFSVTANGTPTLKYQWQFKSGATFSNITGATKSSYTITKVASANAGSYRVIVSNAVGSCASFPASVLTVNPNFAGKYNMAVIGYNATLVNTPGGTHINDGDASGSDHYGPATVTSVAGVSSLAGSLKKYLGDQPGSTLAISGSVSSKGVVTINAPGSNLPVNMILLNGTPIGFLGTGTTTGGTANDTFILGLNATTTAPSSIAACAGNYTLILLSYNATAVSKTNAAQNDGNVELGLVTVAANGTLSIAFKQYATGGGDTLGQTQTLTGSFSSSGVITLSGHPQAKVKFVTLNGQVIGITGTATPAPGKANSSFLIGIKNTSVKPL